MPYVFTDAEKPINYEMYTFKSMMSFYLLFNGLLPLDLAVTLMITKIFMVAFVQFDIHMVDTERSLKDGEIKGCEVKNLTMLEDLSRITHLFCDKTGTLTKNELVFRSIAIGRNNFEMDQTEEGLARFKTQINDFAQKDEKFIDFWRCLCLCHDVVQIKIKGHPENKFTGSSQDEITFLEMCKDVGFAQMIERDQNHITIKVKETIEKYTVLRVEEFTSDRKRMSVVVRNESGAIINFIKGADVAIIPRINQEFEVDESNLNDENIEWMDKFAKEGLRTLMFAKRVLSTSETDKSIKEMPIEDFESDLTLLGVTGLEDLLQENVKHCIKEFKEAKIKVWMLTGDKGETAETIGVSCGLIDTDE